MMRRMRFAARGVALLAGVWLGCNGPVEEAPPPPPEALEASSQRKALSGAEDTCDSAPEPRLVAAPSDEAPQPAVRLEGQGLDCGETYELVITRPDGTSTSESLTADTKGKVQSAPVSGEQPGSGQARLYDSRGDEVARTLYYEPVFRYGHLSWRPVGPQVAEFSVTNAFRRVYWGSGPDGLVVTGDTFYEYSGATTLCFGDGACTYPLLYEVTSYDAEEGWVLARAITPREPQVLPGTGVTVPEREPNNGTSYTQDVMQLGDDYSSDISVPYERDYVRFTLTERTTIEARTVLLGMWDSYLYLADANGRQLASDDDSGEGYASLISMTLDAGTYYIGVAGFSSITGTVLVQLREVAIPPPGPITHTYPWDGPFTAHLSGCCRIDGLANAGNSWDRSYSLQTLVRFTPANSAPVSSLAPVVEAPTRTPDFSFQIPATDADGDVLSFRLATWSDGFTYPPPPGLAVSSTGLVSWDTTGTVSGQRWVVQVIIDEHRDGEHLGSSAVDFLLAVTGDLGPAPTCLPPAQTAYTVNAGERVEFTVGAQDPDTWDLLTLDASFIPWGAFTQPALPHQGYGNLSTTFSWRTSSWDAGATYPVRFTVTDSTGQQSECAITITVQSPSNWPPVASAGDDQWVLEGRTVTLSGSGYDPDGDPLTYHWSLVSGTGPEVTLSSPGSPTTSFQVSDDGVYTFQLTVTDSEGASDTSSVSVHVSNAEPSVSATGGELEVGQEFVSSGSFTDPGADSWTATVDYGDGAGPQPLALSQRTFTLRHRYLSPPEYGRFYYVQIVVRDDNGGVGSVYVSVLVRNVAPIISAHPSSLTLDENQIAVVPITITHPGSGFLSVYVDFGDGQYSSSWSQSRQQTFQNVYYMPGTYSLRISVWDEHGGSHTVTIPVVVRDTPPVVQLQGGTSTEGAELWMLGSFSDSGSWWREYTLTVDFGDGSEPVTTTRSFYNNEFGLLHTYADDGTYVVTVTLTDDSGAEGRATATMVVENVAPWAYLDEPYHGIFEGESLWLWGFVTDPGSQDTLTATVDFGDGTPPQPVQLSREFHMWDFYTPEHRFADDGTYEVTLTVMDDDGGMSTVTSRVVVYNMPPAVSFRGGTVDEGSTFSASGSFIDLGDDTWTARVNYGDGSGWQPLALNGKSFSLAHAYARSGTYTVQVSVLDSDGAEGTGSARVTVRNVAPSVTVAGGTQDEGSAFTASGTFTDAGDETRWTASVNYGDGTGWQALPLNGKSFSLSHVYRDNGSYTVSVQVSDGEGQGTGTAQVVIRNVAPGVSAAAGTADEGALLTLTAAITDPGSLDTVVALIDYGDGSAVERRSLDVSRSLTLSHRFADSGTFQVSISVTDDDGGTGTTTVPVQVRNVAPSMVAFLSLGTQEGAQYTGLGQFLEPGADVVTATVDFGDGSAPRQFSQDAQSLNTFTSTHVYADSGRYPLTVTLTDDDGGTSTFTVQVRIDNLAPTATASNDSPAYWGIPVNFTGTATDPSPVDTQAGFTARWELGAGATAAGLTPAHAYAAPGTYVARLRVTDKDGASNSGLATTLVTIRQRPGAVSCVDTTAVFGFPVALGASFVDGLAGGLPGGRSLSFRLGDATGLGSATTDDTGLARVQSPGGLMPGSYPLTVSFAGDSHYTPAEAHCTLTVTQSSGRITGGGLRTGGGARGGFNVAREEELLRGELQFQSDGTSFHAHEVTALGLSADKRQGWFAGVGRDGRAFTAYVEDNGEPGTADVFKLWIDGALQTGDGVLGGGNIQIH